MKQEKYVMIQTEDIFYEQLFKRKKRFKDYALQVAIFVIALALSMGVCMGLTAWFKTGQLQMLVVTAAIAGIVYVAYKLSIRLDVEFEYIYLNGEMDVDKIISKSDRERMITFKANTFEHFGKYEEEKQKADSIPVDRRFDFTSHTGENEVYYAVFNHKEYKKVLILFEPNEKILSDMVRYVPGMQNYRRNLSRNTSSQEG